MPVFRSRPRWLQPILRLKLIALGSLFLGACNMAPDFMRPFTAAQDRDAFVNADKDLQGEPEMARWWKRLEDREMDRLIAELKRNNPDMNEAAARIMQAEAQIGIERGPMFPSLSLAASGERTFRPAEEFSTFFPGAGNIGGGTQRIYDTSLQTALQTSWQLDLFGRIRNATKAARARLKASRAEREALLHTLVAELAKGRVALAALNRQIELTKAIVDNRKKTLETTQRRYELGTGDVSAADLHLARENLASAKSEADELARARDARAYRVDILLGRAPGTTAQNVDMKMIVPERDTPAGVPAALLDRRPDLRSAELRLRAANAEIGVAVANLYPDISLNGSIGFEDSESGDLFTSERMIGSLAGDIVTRLFQGGRLRANIDLSEARVRELAADYAGQVLQAMREVETALSAQKWLDSRIVNLAIAAQSARSAEKDTRSRYEKGVAPLIALLEAERRAYVAEQALIRARQAQWDTRINLYLALGGDWQIPAAAGAETMNENKEPGER